MGELPKTGEWIRLAVNAKQVGLKPKAKVNGIAFTQFDGKIFWDKVGVKSTRDPRSDPTLSLAKWTDSAKSDKNLPADVVKAAKKAGRVAAEGLVHAYIHTGGRVGVLLEVNCETDFVAKTDGFKELVNDVALHIAAANPLFLVQEDIDEETRAKQFELFTAQGIESGKPEHIVKEHVVPGRMRKWAEEICLMSQPFVKDPDKTIADVVKEATAGIGERVVVRRFSRYEVGEGLEKRKDDFAAEVAAVAGG